MKKRFLIGPLLLLAIAGLLALDELVWPGAKPAVSLLLAVLAAAGWWELSAMVGMSGKPRGGESEAGPGVGRARALRCVGLLGVLYFHGLAWATSSSVAVDWLGSPSYEAGAAIGVFGLLLVGHAVVVFRRDFARYYRPLQETVVGVLLLGLVFSYCMRIYHHGPDALGATIVFFLGIKGTDIAAYLVGSWIGRNRFLAVSPKKSVEGGLAALAWGALWFALAPRALADDLFPWSAGALFGIILGVAAQLGDYAESLVKRQYRTKDSGALLPEFGGILDLTDSLVFSGFLFWYML